MVNSAEVKKLAEERGFSLWATIGDTTLQFIDNSGINMLVHLENGSFQFMCGVPKSIFTLNCPECSPFTNEAHFTKMHKKFKKYAEVIRFAIE